jgi:sulfide:quinone oxidoreductase
MRVVVAGGGVAGLEAILALRELAEERVELELLGPEPFYWYRPLAVAEPFERGSTLRVDLVEVGAVARATFTLATLGKVDPEQRCVWTAAGARFDYDALVIACGARPQTAVRGAFTFRGPADSDGFRRLLGELESGAVRRVAFVVPAGVVWPLPLYELALLTVAHLAGCGLDGFELILVTEEEQPLELLGPEAVMAVQQLLDERGIAFRGGTSVCGFDEGLLTTARGEQVVADRVVALPILRGVPIEGVPRGWQDFITVDPHGRVLGVDGVYAAGDITSFPVKQGGLAAQQADAVAETIAATAGVPIDPQPFQPVLRGKLLTGAIPRFLRAPLTSDSETDVAVEPLWWPPAKIAARRLSPFLAGHALERPRTEMQIPVELELGGRYG